MANPLINSGDAVLVVYFPELVELECNEAMQVALGNK